MTFFCHNRTLRMLQNVQILDLNLVFSFCLCLEVFHCVFFVMFVKVGFYCDVKQTKAVITLFYYLRNVKK